MTPPSLPEFDRRLFLRAGAAGAVLSSAALGSLAWAHHGWSSFDQERPLYLHGRASEVKWRNPHAELILERSGLALPSDLAQRAVPAQVAAVDGRSLLARATLPQRPDARWMVELAAFTRTGQWAVAAIRNGAGTVTLLYPNSHRPRTYPVLACWFS